MTQQTTKLPQKNLRKTGQRVDLPLQDTQKDWGAPKVARRVAKTIRRRAVTHTRDMRAAHRRAVTPLVKSITREIADRDASTREKEEAREAKAAKDTAEGAAATNSSV
jgi:hypothetical protein